MSAREELFEALMPPYRSQYAPGEEESANALLDAYADEIRREFAHRASARLHQQGDDMDVLCGHTTNAGGAFRVAANMVKVMAR
ncbi:hypothetical protein [Streptomyces lycii]|uniref:Uncharacterized protein n=1 Tax=Streptomyces lycii TaxID=2654337 RepID=A0ABQ7FII1_9ACTN|nr:hypothetical protein [Streptomyces lycii]KAF4408645.1 hypothetical protein GCU69_13175 [Streptomyces lycii]